MISRYRQEIIDFIIKSDYVCTMKLKPINYLIKVVYELLNMYIWYGHGIVQFYCACIFFKPITIRGKLKNGSSK